MNMWKTVLGLCVFTCLSACSQAPLESHAPANSKSSTPDSGTLSAFHAAIGSGSPPPASQTGASVPMAHAYSAQAAAFTFAAPQQYQTIYESAWETFKNVWIADVTGDGRSDVVATGTTHRHKLYVFTQQPDGSLSSPVVHLLAGVLAVADFNEDGVSDVMFLDYQNINMDGTPKFGALVSNGQGGLQRIIAYKSLPHHMAWTSLDANGDGHLDLVGAMNVSGTYEPMQCTSVMYSCGGYRVLFGDGKGMFSGDQLVMLGIARPIYDLEAVDLNDDGRKDLVIPMAGNHPTIDPFGEVLVAHALPAGGLATPRLLHAGYGSGPGQHLTFGDVTGDGIVDSILTPADQQDKPVIRKRLLDNTFAYWADLWSYRIYPGLILAEDFDGDRKTDLVSIQIITWGLVGLGFYQQSNGALLAPTYTQFSEFNAVVNDENAMAAGDYNGDGCKDVVSGSNDMGLYFFAGSNCVAAPRVMPDETGYVRQGVPGG